MGQTLSHGVYLPNEGERNCYAGLASNWQILNTAVGNIAEKAPLVHTHGNISNDGKVGTTANVPLITGTGGAVQAGSFGNQANTFCEGNDSRLSDARTPVAHTHSKADITDLFNSANTWSALNTYSNSQIRIKSQSQEIGVIPSSGVIQYLEFADKNDAQHGKIGLWDYDNGASEIQVSISDKYKNGAKDPTGTLNTAFLSFGFQYNGTKFITFSGQVNNSVIPLANNTYGLGSSSYKWKTLNGVNPGALSLPNLDSDGYIDLSGHISANSEYLYTPTVDGWLALYCQTTGFHAENAVGIFNREDAASYRWADTITSSINLLRYGTYHGSIILPVRAGIQYGCWVVVNSSTPLATSTLFFYKAKGNV